MAITAQYIVHRAAETLQDLTSVRWPASELVRYLNDGQREIGFQRPDAVQQTIYGYALVAGASQSLPAGGNKLITVRCNGNNGSAVRLVSQLIMDQQIPNWRSLTQKSTIVHYMYDERFPKYFLVYPPAALGATVDLSCSMNPTDITEPPDGSIWSDVDNSTELSVIDLYSNVLVDYVLFRAYSKDAEYAANAQLAQVYYAAFANALGMDVKTTLAVSPRSSDSSMDPAVLK